MLASLMTDLIEHPAEAFGRVFPAVLLGLAVVLLLHFVLLSIARSRSGRGKPLSRWNLWERLVYLATIPAVAMLGVTAFYAVLVDGALHGWLLLAHMVWSGLFVAVLPMISLTWAASCRFGSLDKNEAATGEPTTKFLSLTKIAFWLILVGGVVTAGTMLASMLPLFGTEGLQQLLDVHRYAGLLVVVAVSVHFYTICLGRLGLTSGD